MLTSIAQTNASNYSALRLWGYEGTIGDCSEVMLACCSDRRPGDCSCLVLPSVNPGRSLSAIGIMVLVISSSLGTQGV